MCAMKQVWEIGQRKFAKDFRRRIWMFDHLLKSILMYETEDGRNMKLERCQVKFIKWILGLYTGTLQVILLGTKQKTTFKNRDRKKRC